MSSTITQKVLKNKPQEGETTESYLPSTEPSLNWQRCFSTQIQVKRHKQFACFSSGHAEHIMNELSLLIIKLKEAKQKRNYLGTICPIIF